MENALPPDQLAARLAEVYVELGRLYRKVAVVVERSQPVMGMSVGVRAVLEQLSRLGERTVPQLARAQDLSRQFVQRTRLTGCSRGRSQIGKVSNFAYPERMPRL